MIFLHGLLNVYRVDFMWNDPIAIFETDFFEVWIKTLITLWIKIRNCSASQNHWSSPFFFLESEYENRNLMLLTSFVLFLPRDLEHEIQPRRPFDVSQAKFRVRNWTADWSVSYCVRKNCGPRGTGFSPSGSGSSRVISLQNHIESD